MFSTTDLMINLAAQAAGGAAPAFCFGLTGGCWCTYWTCGGSCAWSCYGTRCLISGCGASLQVAAATDPAAASQQLAALKAQLQQALSEIEKQEQAVEASSQPQTVAQVEEQERKLQGELAKLGQRKKELAKK